MSIRTVSALSIVAVLCLSAIVPMTQTNAAGTSMHSAAARKSRMNQRLQRRLEAKQKRQSERAKKISGNEIIGTGFTMFGDESSPVTVVEFTDYQCPFCARFHHDTFKQMQTKYWDGTKSSVRFVVRNFPLSFHSNAMDLARVVECTREDLETDAGPLATKIFKEQQLSGASSITIEDVYGWIQKSAMDLPLIKQCVQSGKRDAQIQADVDAGGTLGVSGTPNFIVIAPNGTTQLIQGAVPFETFRAAIEAALLTK